MKLLVILFAAISLCHARSHVGFVGSARPSLKINGDQYLCVVTDASPGEFPWQLSVTYRGSHSSGASLLSSTYGLTAAHVVDGALPANLGVWAGLYQLSETAGAQYSDISSYTLHENYSQGTPSYSNDIAILNFGSTIIIGGNVQVAILPANNANDYTGLTCVISGWSLTSSSTRLSDTLQKVSIEVISSSQCNSMMAGVGGANIWANHICVYDNVGQACSCKGDSGGPLSCPDGGTVVAGIQSWVVSSGTGNCLSSYPSVYTRTSAYLGWIASHTP